MMTKTIRQADRDDDEERRARGEAALERVRYLQASELQRRVPSPNRSASEEKKLYAALMAEKARRMIDPIVIRLAGEPKGKGRPRFVRATGHAFTPASTRSYEAALRYAGQEAMAGRPPLDGPLHIDVEAALPVPASWSKRRRAEALCGLLWPTVKPDLDNILKGLDSLNQVVFVDDKQIVVANVRKSYSEAPSLTVRISQIRG